MGKEHNTSCPEGNPVCLLFKRRSAGVSIYIGFILHAIRCITGTWCSKNLPDMFHRDVLGIERVGKGVCLGLGFFVSFWFLKNKTNSAVNITELAAM